MSKPRYEGILSPKTLYGHRPELTSFISVMIYYNTMYRSCNSSGASEW